MQETRKPLRGFASMTPERRREIAAKGGRSVRPEQRSFSKDRDLARTAGKVGGESIPPKKRSFSQNPGLAAIAGKKGGQVSKGGQRRTLSRKAAKGAANNV